MDKARMQFCWIIENKSILNMRMLMGQVVIGHLTMDNIWGLSENKVQKGIPGGAAMYAACGAAIWNKEVTVVSKMGNDYVLHKPFNDNFEGRINTSCVTRVDKPSIRLNIKYDSKNEHIFEPLTGVESYSEMAPSVSEISDYIIQHNHVFHISPLPIQHQYDIIGKIRDIEQQKKYITLDPDILDISSKNIKKWQDILTQIDVLILSRIEFEKFESLFNSVQHKHCIFKRICTIKQLFTIKNIILKMGHQGAYLVKENGEQYFVGTIENKYKDYTGAGDAFAGGLGYALDIGLSLERGLAYGTVASSIAMKDFGYKHMLETSQTEWQNLINFIERDIQHEKANIHCNKVI
ncbi:MAG: carbohydrate kinase family protein [Lachnoclostridium sp.]|nr:carbohydrate kinase family protein [Lachnospira sp.]MCM1248915.1 carbohydrate kinase family protein [Lachnoclostridium sp.]MCM1535229.1 carbohydrate kinase family protein [Clostridium sp.]